RGDCDRRNRRGRRNEARGELGALFTRDGSQRLLASAVDDSAGWQAVGRRVAPITANERAVASDVGADVLVLRETGSVVSTEASGKRIRVGRRRPTTCPVFGAQRRRERAINPVVVPKANGCVRWRECRRDVKA